MSSTPFPFDPLFGFWINGYRRRPSFIAVVRSSTERNTNVGIHRTHLVFCETYSCWKTFSVARGSRARHRLISVRFVRISRIVSSRSGPHPSEEDRQRTTSPRSAGRIPGLEISLMSISHPSSAAASPSFWTCHSVFLQMTVIFIVFEWIFFREDLITGAAENKSVGTRVSSQLTLKDSQKFRIKPLHRGFFFGSEIEPRH